MLSNQHYCQFHDQSQCIDSKKFNELFFQIQQAQWTIPDHTQWKLNEHWPDNAATFASPVCNLNKFYLTCAWVDRPEMQYPGTKVLLYTDIDTQLAVAQFKRCGWLFKVENLDTWYYQTCNRIWLQSYDCVKEQSWPTVNLDKIDQLPNCIAQELREQHSGFDWFFAWHTHRNNYLTWREVCIDTMTTEFQDSKVWQPVADLAPCMDVIIKLQQVLTSQGRALTDALELPYSDKHRELVQHWMNLHSYELQQMFLR